MIRQAGLTIFLLAAAGIAAQSALAASAVAVNPENHQYVWRTDQNIDQAKATSLEQCAKISGSECAVFSVCGLPGRGAIAFNKASGHWGAACAAKEAERAREFALDNCNIRSLGKGACEIIETYNDLHSGEALAVGYFAGKWAENCKAKTWNKFRAVNDKEFRLLACTSAKCSDRPEVFRSLFGETVFHWPTNNTRIRKQGPNTIEVTATNSKYLKRCGN